jgi:hypothetical protein
MTTIDRGIVKMERTADGSTNIYVCTDVKEGLPAGVFAQYVGIPSANVQVDVPMLRAGRLSYTRGVVEVAPTDTGVHIRAIPVAAGS